MDEKELIKLTIKGIFSQPKLLDVLVLKGGNALDLIYGGSGRASNDVDLSMDMSKPELPKDELEHLISTGLKTVFADSGLTVFDIEFKEVPKNMTPDLSEFWGGYKVLFKAVSSDKYTEEKEMYGRMQASGLQLGGKGKIHIDVSRHEYCDPKQIAQLDDVDVSVYTTDMIVAEKLRAICQQTDLYTEQTKSHKTSRAKDYFDIYTLYERGAFSGITPVFAAEIKSAFLAKNVGRDCLLLASNDKAHHENSFIELVESLNTDIEVLAFEEYFEFVMKLLQVVHSLWDE